MTEASWPRPEEMDAIQAAPGSHKVLIDNDRVHVAQRVAQRDVRRPPALVSWT